MTSLDQLLKQAADDRLGHFYLVETNLNESESFLALTDFIHHFIRDYYQKIEKQTKSIKHLMDHPDVYLLGNTPQDEDPVTTPFTVEEAEKLARFLEFKPVESKRKFIVITEGHRINHLVANKWLKLLEEPQGHVTIFLLNPRGQKLLATIHSRAHHLKLHLKRTAADRTEWDHFISEVKQQSLSQFLEIHAKSEKDTTYWTNQLIQFESDHLDHPELKSALLSWTRKLQEMDLFHQPSATKWSLFYSLLKQHILTTRHR